MQRYAIHVGAGPDHPRMSRYALYPGYGWRLKQHEFPNARSPE